MNKFIIIILTAILIGSLSSAQCVLQFCTTYKSSEYHLSNLLIYKDSAFLKREVAAHSGSNRDDSSFIKRTVYLVVDIKTFGEVLKFIKSEKQVLEDEFGPKDYQTLYYSSVLNCRADEMTVFSWQQGKYDAIIYFVNLKSQLRKKGCLDDKLLYSIDTIVAQLAALDDKPYRQ